ncbi:palmitoyltransferase ZDHHC6-like [Tubulanus polymorphus]|uniref:palmitoyltransferase ZDHHC6-like n=1 Tax=Tubulanus polymorphus TaxID=672921 RepID=UPI003DA68401
MNIVRRTLHWGPLLALFIIFTISAMSIICDMMWWPVSAPGGTINLIVYVMWLYLTLYNFFCAMGIGPGHVPYGWKPDDPKDIKYLQFCKVCQGYKSPRSHHCRKCNRCVMKMDHHCPWINNCCGHMNHARFTYFLFFAPLGCIHSLCILIPSLYHAMNRPYYFYYGDGTEPVINLDVWSFLIGIFSVGLAVGVIVAVGGLGFLQLKSILKNETGIESWIIEKAYYIDRTVEEGEFVYPYYLGMWRNLRQVFTWSGYPVSDGFTWDVKEGCNQYTLTIEQMRQKEDKKDRSIEYTIIEDYSGRWCPITKGCRVICCPPFTDEPRIKLNIGDRLLVTRWKKHWLYGDKILDKQQKDLGVSRLRGWFPRRCAVEFVNNGCSYPDLTKLKQRAEKKKLS